MSLCEQWLAMVDSKLGPLDPLERDLVLAGAVLLATNLPNGFDVVSLREHSNRCASLLAAMVDVTRSLAKGDHAKAKLRVVS